MSGDTDADADELLTSLLVAMDGDSGDSLEARFPLFGGFSNELEADNDALLDLFPSLLESDDRELDDDITARGGVTASSLGESFDVESETPVLSTVEAWISPEIDGKLAAASSMAMAEHARGVESVGRLRSSKQDPNKARKARAEELRGLRSAVEEMTDQVKALRAMGNRAEKRLPAESTTQYSASPAGSKGAPPLWEAICRNQLARRVRTERENARLKRALDEQENITKGLQRLIKKSTKVQKTIGGLDACSARRVYALPSDSDADIEILDRLVAEVDASYIEANNVFELNGIPKYSDKARRGRNMRQGEHGQFVDMFASDLLPFSLESTSDVVWDFYSGPNKHRGPLYYKTATLLKDTIVEKFAIELTANDTRADFRMWKVLRRYVDANRVLVVWVCLVEPVEFANKSFAGCKFRENGYVACSSASDENGADIPGFTRLKRCHRVVPFTTHAPGERLSEQEKHEIGAVIEFVLGLDSISVHLQMFQDELMQRGLSLRERLEGVD